MRRTASSISSSETVSGGSRRTVSGPVAFSNGSLTSGLTYTFTSLASTTDDVAFSNDNGTTWTYTPVPNANGVDPNVTNLRINPKGTFAGDPTPGTPSPSCTASFRVRIE